MKCSSIPSFATLLAVLTGLFVAAGLRAGEPTAFDLVKEGNKHVGEEAKGRVVEIRSEKSVATLTPNIWFVVYYDPDATAKATEVKFMGGKKSTVKRPARILEPITGAHKELAKDKLKIDSDQALDLAKSEPVLKNLTLKSAQMWLQGRGDDRAPTWKVRFWAAKLNDSKRSVDIGDLFLSAETGKVVKNDLHIDRVD